MPKITVPERNILQLGDVAELCEREDDPRVRCLVALAYTFGSRISEYMALKKADFAEVDGALRVTFLLKKKREKGRPYVGVRQGWDRYISLSYPLVKFIKPYIDGVKEGYIFPSDRSGDRLRYVRYVSPSGEVVEKFYKLKGGHLTDDWARWKLKQLDAGLYWHFFRRSAITNIAYKEGSILAAKDFAGHASVATTEIYVSSDPATQKKLANRDY